LDRSVDGGEQGTPWTQPSKGGQCWCELQKGTMPNALTLADMSPGLRKVVGRESPRATSAEEPDAGNPLVRIWRGAGTGNLPAYSTSTFGRSSLPQGGAWYGTACAGARRRRGALGGQGRDGTRHCHTQ